MSYPYQKHTWVSKEIIRREYLQNIEDGIYDEQQERILSESNIETSITAERTRAVAKESELNAAILAETSRSTGIENTLTSGLDNANVAIDELESNLNAEIARAQSAESTLSTMASGINSNLTDEVTRAQNAETTLAANLSSEVTRAQSAESALRDYVDEKISTAYKPSGSIYFVDLPPLERSRVGNVYDIKDDFTTTADFLEGAGKHYNAGQNVAIVVVDAYIEVDPVGTENPYEEGWLEYNGEEYVLSEDTTVDSEKTYYRVGEVYKYDVMSEFINLSDYVQKTDYASTSEAGIAKVDGTTITIDSDGVIHSANSELTNFCGTVAEWDALTIEQKDQYETVDLLDD